MMVLQVYAEAVLMAHRSPSEEGSPSPRPVHPEYRRVIQTYIDPDQQEIVLFLSKERGNDRHKALF